MTKINLRQQYIDEIMENKYGDDDPQYYDSNLEFLNGLSIKELASMASNEFEDEEEEVLESDFDDNEIDFN